MQAQRSSESKGSPRMYFNPDKPNPLKELIAGVTSDKRDFKDTSSAPYLDKFFRTLPNSSGRQINNFADLSRTIPIIKTQPEAAPVQKIKPTDTENLFDPGDERQKQMLGTVLNLTSAEVSSTAKAEDGTTRLERAVRSFQGQNNLPSTGKIDKETANKIENTFDKALQQKRYENFLQEQENEITGEINSDTKSINPKEACGNKETYTHKEMEEKLHLIKADWDNATRKKRLCPNFRTLGCTTLEKIPKKVELLLNQIRSECPKCEILLTGGTEIAGHVSHGPNKAIFDMAYFASPGKPQKNLNDHIKKKEEKLTVQYFKFINHNIGMLLQLTTVAVSNLEQI